MSCADEPDTYAGLRAETERLEDLIVHWPKAAHASEPNALVELVRNCRDLEGKTRSLMDGRSLRPGDNDAEKLLAYAGKVRRECDASLDLEVPSAGLLLALTQMADVLRRRERSSELALLDEPSRAFNFILGQLPDATNADLSKLLGAPESTVSEWRSGGTVDGGADRIRLVAHIIYNLRGSLTQRGLLMWFENPMDRFGGKSPCEMMDESVSGAWQRLINLSHEARGQLHG